MPKKVIQYVVTRRERDLRTRSSETLHGDPVESVAGAIRAMKGVQIVGELDDATALVKMSAAARSRLERDRPDLLIEENLSYRITA